MNPLETVMRDEWGRLLALLAAQFRRLDLAEDSLAEAFESAARAWPADGVPANPPAWLLTAARRRALDRLRAEAVAAKSLPLLAVEAEITANARRVLVDASGELGAVDERLRLILLCAHPSLPAESAAALTLRLVLGVPTADIARLFLVPTATMAARVTRARKRLSGARFDVPVGPALQERVEAVADVAYLAFTAAYAPGSGSDVVRAAEAGEALRLVQVLREVAPAAYELDALLALMMLQHARRDARVEDGRLVLLPDQDRSRWRMHEIADALTLLTPLIRDAPSTPYLLQALIAAEHSTALRAEHTDWGRISEWYDELEALTGSPVVRLNRAVAVAEAESPEAGLELLDGLDLPGHRLPAVRAELLVRADRLPEALAAYDTAIAACDNAAERAHLTRRSASLR
ncbi:RNA polymerase subunit sigma-24 [Kribbella sindirgiensis]|uniref:RNA polymerase subunit sigma-24 n=2 Tax=Kribbella sindirgiensis TaxID=1124744 RepID=A0A4R0J015_9ACTN|nr:RNA polymerase subunit sigma-24 [Kribbella sindirgiensis]